MTDLDPHGRAAAALEEGRPVEAQYARQGRRGTRILWLLVASTALAALILFGLYAMNSGGFSFTNQNTGVTTSDARAFDQNEPLAPKQNSPSSAPSPE